MHETEQKRFADAKTTDNKSVCSFSSHYESEYTAEEDFYDSNQLKDFERLKVPFNRERSEVVQTVQTDCSTDSDEYEYIDSEDHDSDENTVENQRPEGENGLSGTPDNVKIEKKNIESDIVKATEYKIQANQCFSDKKFKEALKLYIKAILFCPENDELLPVLFSNKAACHLSLGEYELAVEDSSESIEINKNYSKAYIRRYRGYCGLKKYHEALADLKKALELSPELQSQYESELKQVEKLSNDQFETEKQEMVDKLKSFGNWALGKVGLSLDNFKMEQNEQGSYNISFKQN